MDHWAKEFDWSDSPHFGLFVSSNQNIDSTAFRRTVIRWLGADSAERIMDEWPSTENGVLGGGRKCPNVKGDDLLCNVYFDEFDGRCVMVVGATAIEDKDAKVRRAFEA